MRFIMFRTMFLYALVIWILLFFCGTNQKNQTDVRIGDQVWSTRNLDISKFRNGDPILQAQDNAEWKEAYINESPAWCYCENDPINGKKYGKLYNWYAVNDIRELAPQGWHIPSKEEFETLLRYYGGEGTPAYNALKQGGSSGFNSLFGGSRLYNGYFDDLDAHSHYWSASRGKVDTDAWGLSLGGGGEYAYVSYGPKGCGFSVRCVHD